MSDDIQDDESAREADTVRENLIPDPPPTGFDMPSSFDSDPGVMAIKHFLADECQPFLQKQEERDIEIAEFIASQKKRDESQWHRDTKHGRELTAFLDLQKKRDDDLKEREERLVSKMADVLTETLHIRTKLDEMASEHRTEIDAIDARLSKVERQLQGLVAQRQ